jgi:hypothetical protein
MVIHLVLIFKQGTPKTLSAIVDLSASWSGFGPVAGMDVCEWWMDASA